MGNDSWLGSFVLAMSWHSNVKVVQLHRHVSENQNILTSSQ